MVRVLVFGLLVGLLATGCDRHDSAPAGEGLRDTLDEARRLIDDLAPQRKEWEEDARGEVEKLYNFEYHIEEFSNELSTVEIEAKLDALGQDRWECFHIEPGEKELRVFCKRRPKTYLRYMLRVL